MFPDAEPSLTSVATLAGDAPSLFEASLRVGLVVLLLAGAGWAWFFWLKRNHGGARRLEVQERAFLTRGAGVALLRVDDRQLLVGVSAEGVRLISELDRENGPTFGAVLAEVSEDEATG